MLATGPSLVQQRAKQDTNTGLDYQNLNRGERDPRKFTSPGKRHEGMPPDSKGMNLPEI